MKALPQGAVVQPIDIESGDGSMEAQLVALYRDQQRLHEQLGTSDTEATLAIIASLSAQLRALYAERDQADGELPVAGASG